MISAGKGWMGTLIRVNLTDGTIRKEPLDMQSANDYVGARGLGTKYYCDEVDPNIDPLSPENKIIFMTGPLTGTAACSGGRYDVISKGPLTGTIDASNSGGHFGPELKFAGYDGIIFEGKADHPVYLHIDDELVELLDASELWGKDVHYATDALVEKHGSVRVATIGTPGERGMLYAGIMNDKNRAAGRGGMGAVMGSKNLKAVVVRGTGGVKVARPKEFMMEVTKARATLQSHPVTGNGLGALGTQILVNIVNEVGGLPLHNGRDGSFWDKADDTSGERLAQTYLVKNQGCFGCSIACGRVTKIEGRGNLDGLGEGPEYEAGWSYGAACGVADLGAIVKCNFICNEQGMDPISLGSTVACAMELFEMGAIPEEDIGFPLRFGDADAMVKLTQMCADGEGFGKIDRPGLLPPGRALRAPRALHEREEAGDARLRRPRHPGHRPRVRDVQPRRLPRARLHDLPGGAGPARQDGPARHRGQGRHAQDVPGPHGAVRLGGHLPVHDLCHRAARDCRPVPRGRGQRRIR